MSEPAAHPTRDVAHHERDSEGDEVTIAWNSDHDRWEARAEGGLLVGRLDVVGHGQDPEDFAHTVVEPAYGGRGIGGRLVHAAFEDALDRGVTVVPSCSFVRAWVADHAEYQDLVAG